MQPVDQPTSKPTPKVAAVGIAGVIMTLVVAVAGVFHFTLPASLGDNVTSLVTGVVALVSIVHFLVGYFKRDTIQLTTVPPAPIVIPVVDANQGPTSPSEPTENPTSVTPAA